MIPRHKYSKQQHDNCQYHQRLNPRQPKPPNHGVTPLRKPMLPPECLTMVLLRRSAETVRLSEKLTHMAAKTSGKTHPHDRISDYIHKCKQENLTGRSLMVAALIRSDPREQLTTSGSYHLKSGPDHRFLTVAALIGRSLTVAALIRSDPREPLTTGH
jgi:hypothetical protein